LSTRDKKKPGRTRDGREGAATGAGWPAKRAAIVEAAKRVFLREGFARASVDVIAAEGGVSKQTVYNHFGDKERLFFAVIESVQGGPAADQERALDAFFDADAAPAVALRALGQRLVATLYRGDLAALRRLMVAEVAHYPQLRLAWARGGPLSLMIRLTSYLVRQVERGALDVPRPERAARQFIALLGSDANELSAFGTVPLSTAQIDVIVDDAVAMFLRAYGPRTAAPGGGSPRPVPVRRPRRRGA
jgi:TetR/AcrR family transcriptional repressor of mexJK operon